MNGKFQLRDIAPVIRQNSEAMHKKRIAFIDNPNEFNNDYVKQNLSLNELINANYSVNDSPIPNNKHNLNIEEANNNKHMTDCGTKEMGASIDLIDINMENKNNSPFGNRNCDHRFDSKFNSYSNINFFSNEVFK